MTQETAQCPHLRPLLFLRTTPRNLKKETQETGNTRVCRGMALLMSPSQTLVLLWGSRIIQADLTGAENGLPREPYLRILLQCRGGMRGGPRGSTQSGSGSRGRGYRSSEGGDKQMGGGLTTEAGKGHITPLGRGERGRGRGNFLHDTRRRTLVHTAAQEPIDANRLNASLKATQESH